MFHDTRRDILLCTAQMPLRSRHSRQSSRNLQLQWRRHDDWMANGLLNCVYKSGTFGLATCLNDSCLGAARCADRVKVFCAQTTVATSLLCQ